MGPGRGAGSEAGLIRARQASPEDPDGEAVYPSLVSPTGVTGGLGVLRWNMNLTTIRGWAIIGLYEGAARFRLIHGKQIRYGNGSLHEPRLILPCLRPITEAKLGYGSTPVQEPRLVPTFLAPRRSCLKGLPGLSMYSLTPRLSLLTSVVGEYMAFSWKNLFTRS